MEHGDEHSDMEDEESEMDSDSNACPHCGLLFASGLNLAKHKETCTQRPVPSSDIFGPIDDNDDEENEDAWVNLIVHLNNEIRDKFEEKKQEYIASGESDKRAHVLTKKDMKPQFKEDMKAFTRKSLIFVLQLRNSRYFEDIFEDLLHCKKEKGFGWEKAVRTALDRNSEVFGKVLRAEDIGKEVRSEQTDTAEDSEHTNDSMEDEEEEEDESSKPIFP